MQPANRLSLVATMMFIFESLPIIIVHYLRLGVKSFQECFQMLFIMRISDYPPAQNGRNSNNGKEDGCTIMKCMMRHMVCPVDPSKARHWRWLIFGPCRRSRRRLFELQGGLPWYHPAWLWAKWHISKVWLSFLTGKPEKSSLHKKTVIKLISVCQMNKGFFSEHIKR